MAIPEDEAFSGWTPPSYTVDDRGKVIGAVPGEPNNWGRWGEDDQRGTANLCTPERIASACQNVRRGKAFSLALPMGKRSPLLGTRGAILHALTISTGDDVLGERNDYGLQTSDDFAVIPLQGATQIDGLAHVGFQDTLFNGYWAGLTTTRSGARRLGLQNLADGIIGRAVLADVARHRALDPYRGIIDTADITATLDAAGVTAAPGDIQLVRTGWMAAFRADNTAPRVRGAGLAPSVISWLAENDIAMVATDNRMVEAVPDPEGNRVFPLHVRALRDLGLLLGELFDLEELAADCARHDSYTGLFVTAPLPMVGAVGSPINPIVIV